MVCLTEVGHLAKFAFGDAGVEILAVQDIVEVFHAVDFVFAFFRRNQQANVIPFPNRFGRVEGLAGLGIDRGLIERIEPAAANGVGGLFVVLELEFGSGRPGGAALVGDMVHDAAVAGVGNVVIQLQLEPVILIVGAEIAGVFRIGAGQRAVLDLPARPDFLALERVPPVQALAVEEQLPAGLLLVGAKRVGRGLIGRRGGCGFGGVGGAACSRPGHGARRGNQHSNSPLQQRDLRTHDRITLRTEQRFKMTPVVTAFRFPNVDLFNRELSIGCRAMLS